MYEHENWVRGLNIHRTPKAVLLLVAGRANQQNYCFPGQVSIAREQA